MAADIRASEGIFVEQDTYSAMRVAPAARATVRAGKRQAENRGVDDMQVAYVRMAASGFVLEVDRAQSVEVRNRSLLSSVGAEEDLASV